MAAKSGDDADEDGAYGENSIAMHYILRLISQIVVRVNIEDLGEEQALEMFEFAVTCGIHSIEMSEKNVMLTDTAIALLISVIRVLANPALI